MLSELYAWYQSLLQVFIHIALDNSCRKLIYTYYLVDNRYFYVSKTINADGINRNYENLLVLERFSLTNDSALVLLEHLHLH